MFELLRDEGPLEKPVRPEHFSTETVFNNMWKYILEYYGMVYKIVFSGHDLSGSTISKKLNRY